MIVIIQGYKEKSYNIPGLGIVPIKNLQKIEEDSLLGKGLMRYHSQVCFTSSEVAKVEIELLLEEPICVAEVESVEEESPEPESPEPESDKPVETLRPLSEFTDKDALESYGITLGIDLKKNKKIENMYKDLENFYKSL